MFPPESTNEALQGENFDIFDGRDDEEEAPANRGGEGEPEAPNDTAPDVTAPDTETETEPEAETAEPASEGATIGKPGRP